MNIFVVDKDPYRSAAFLDDKRVNKMIIETVQMLSVVLGGPYKKTHQNHPCTRWVDFCENNLNWTVIYLHALHKEYKARRNRDHASFLKFKEFTREKGLTFPEKQTLEQYPLVFCNCSYYPDEKDIFEAYRKTLVEKWKTDKIKPKWYGRTEYQMTTRS